MISKRILTKGRLMPLETSKDVECDDKSLVRRSVSGDQQAFRQLYDKHVARVYAVCFRLSSDKDEASDIVQEVFIQVWTKIRNYRGDSAFSTWLHRVSTNIAISHIRKRNRWWLRHTDWDDAEKNEQLKVDEYYFENSLDKKIVELPQQARLVFVLFAIEGYRHDEIAKILRIAVGTSKAQYHRARNLLKEKLKNE